MERDEIFKGYEPEISRVGKLIDKAGEFLARVLAPIQDAPLHRSDHYDPTHFTEDGQIIEAQTPEPIVD